MDYTHLREKFFNDPEWKHVEEILKGFIDPLVDPKNLDWGQNATQFKAELRAKYKIYEQLSKFLVETGIIKTPLKEIKNPWR